MKPDIPWIINNKILHHGPRHEMMVQKVLRRYQGDLFIDIGSNRGIFTRIAQKRFNRVLSVDPNPKYDAELKVAVSSRNGRANFYINDDLGSADSLIRNPHILGRDYQNENRIIQVDTVTFDDLKLNADLVKIDVEGAEFEVIDGMKDYLPKALIIELHDERRQVELIDKMGMKGYWASKIDDTHWLFSR